MWNAGNWPNAANPNARARLTAFFASGGGYLGAGGNGANFLVSGAQVTGLTPASRSCQGCSGIVYWDNEGGAASPVVGTYPSRDTAIMDPPTWFTAVPATLSVDGRLPTTGFFAAGLWDSFGYRAGGGRDRARDEHRRDGAAHRVRDEPALSRRSRAGVADGRVGRVLGGPLGRRAVRRAAAVPPPRAHR